MTALRLLAFICAALSLELLVAIVLAWRRRTIESDGSSHRSTVVRATAGAWTGWREFRVAKREFEDVARSQCSFYLEPSDGAPLPAFKPGQFLTVEVQPGVGGPLARCYSLSDVPDVGRYRITVKKVAAQPSDGRQSRSASCYLHDQVDVGDVIKARAPAGQFFVGANGAAETVFIAGGIGITPVLSMLRSMLLEQPGKKIHLYYGVRNGDEHAFKAQLASLAMAHRNFHLSAAYSQPSSRDEQGRDYQHIGHLSVDLLRRTLPHGHHEFYVCGPPRMMQSVIPALEAWGVPANSIHYEAFGPASGSAVHGGPKPADRSPAISFDVQFRRTGRTVCWDGSDESLLALAERHGVAIDSGCRSGSCGTCETDVVSGAVHYAHPPEYDATPGHCLLCVATPKSALVLDA